MSNYLFLIDAFLILVKIIIISDVLVVCFKDVLDNYILAGVCFGWHIGDTQNLNNHRRFIFYLCTLCKN